VTRSVAEELRGKRVLVTGGLGFIGSNLAHALARAGARVTVVDSLIPDYGGCLFNLDGVEDLVRVNIADIRDPHGMSYLVRDQDAIFNLAGQVSHLDSVGDPLTDLDINCRAQVTLLEACRRHNPGVPVVFASTRQLYGRPRSLPVDEGHPINPVDPNGVSKAAGEAYHLLYHRVHGLRACALRLTNTYGPRMRVKDARQTFVGWWFHELVDGRPIKVFGDGAQVRDFNFVDDVVEALVLAGLREAAAGQVYNLGGEGLSLRALAERLVAVNHGGSFEVVPFPPERKAIDIGDYRGDFGKIRAQLGWEPRVPLEEGLARTLEFYRQNRERYW
jgi:UDP-glucose 4-epimerase